MFQLHFCRRLALFFICCTGQIDGQEVTAATVHVPKPQPRPPRRSPPPPRRGPPPPRSRRRYGHQFYSFGPQVDLLFGKLRPRVKHAVVTETTADIGNCFDACRQLFRCQLLELFVELI
jgi:hypothetical protein